MSGRRAAAVGGQGGVLIEMIRTDGVDAAIVAGSSGFIEPHRKLQQNPSRSRDRVTRKASILTDQRSVAAALRPTSMIGLLKAKPWIGCR